MPREGNKWRVATGDCLWNIAKTVYNNPYRYTEIAKANGISNPNLIYPGQLFVLPGITTPSSVTPAPSPAPNYSKKVTIQWFALDAGETRSMFCTWSYDRPNTSGYQVNWDYDTGQGGWRIGSYGTTTEKQSSYSAPENAKKVRVTIKPLSDNWSDGQNVTREYDYSNNPPLQPPVPSIDIDINNVLTSEIENIDTNINADSIEFAIYQDDILKYRVGTGAINIESRYVSYTITVDPGHEYKIRCRGVRGEIYGGYSDFTSNEPAIPIAPVEITNLRSTVISEQTSKIYAIYIEWTEERSAKIYEVQWATSIEAFDVQQYSSQTTEEGAGPKLTITNLELGHEYFFRVASRNNKGISNNYTPIKSVTLGTKPAAPTTYSNVASCVLGEDLNLYWIHNSTDGSLESYARLNLIISDSAHPELQPTEITKVIPNERPEEDQNKPGVYTINTDDPEWATIGEGYVIKWKVQTAGVIEEYSNWSTEREVTVYAQPELTIDIINSYEQSVDNVDGFPFYLSFVASPNAQTPVSYYIEIVSNSTYETIDDTGLTRVISVGDKIYQQTYDPQNNPWEFLLEMTPGNLDLENGVQYTINATVAMNSGLIATISKTFTAEFEDLYYDVYADIVINKETLEANINGFCNQAVLIDNEEVIQLVENCTISIYRKEYDGSFTKIASDVENKMNLYVTDPHPALDYARYRIVAKDNNTGSISYADVASVKVGEPSVVIQWAENWSSFESEDGEGISEPAWSGSMLKIPYNISTSENKKVDVSLVEYTGRQHPVSYYGTQVGETANWSMVIPKEDKETIYALRRLSKWNDDVYVREPNGTGYWANISVSFNINYSDVTIPISMSVTRVEGGI